MQIDADCDIDDANDANDAKKQTLTGTVSHNSEAWEEGEL
jgi:hypothetical protein